MESKQRKAFESIVRRGHPSDVRCYTAIIDRVIASCKPEELDEMYPFEASKSNLSDALWRLKTDFPRPRSRRGWVDYFIREHNMTSQQFADEADVPYGSVTKMRAGYMTSGPSVDRAREYIRSNFVENI